VFEAAGLLGEAGDLVLEGFVVGDCIVEDDSV